MSVRTSIENLDSIENGGDVINYLLDSGGLNYNNFVELPSGIKRNQGRNDWYEAHLVDANGNGVIRYIELEASGDSPAFSGLRRHLKRHGSPINELFTVIAYRESDEGPLTSPLNDDLTFLHIEEQFSSEDVEVTFDLNYFTIKRFGVEPAYLDYLDNLSVGSGQGRTSLEGDVSEVFSIREITRSFYQDFGEIFREDLQEAIHGLENSEENLNAYTRTVVNRVLFLLFIEEKGWLDGDVDYVENKYEEVAEEPELHVYDDLFEPLFFEALSKKGTVEPDRLGQIPFLNGGLFERKGIERNVEIDEIFFDKLLSPEEGDDGEPEGFLRRYKISLRESNPSEQELVVDPEFIGRIFEMFMQEDERSEVGAFYTPKPITAYMTKNALKQHLLRQTNMSHEEAVSLVSDHTAPESLSDAQFKKVNDALRSATVLDPAVGSGAFIIAMLEELVAVSEALDDSTGDDRSRFQLKKEFIADTLYGVDIDAGGIELCKFRVWLHLMEDLNVGHDEFVDSNEEFALPNLGFKFFVGNSLVGEHDPTNVDAQQATLAGGLDETLKGIHKVRTDYQTAHGDEKARLAKDIEELTDKLETQLAVKKGDWMDPVADAAEETFAWTTNIPEVTLEGGFDIVIGNPPYKGGDEASYITSLSHFLDEKYDFYTKPIRKDLYQKFIYRAFELAKQGGIVSYITSNTFLTIDSKISSRRLLLNNEILEIINGNPATFEAAVHPAIFTVRKTSSPQRGPIRFIEGRSTAINEFKKFVSGSEGLEVDPDLYLSNIDNKFFYPNEKNIDLYHTLFKPLSKTAEKWEDAIEDIDEQIKNQDAIESNLSEKTPGDLTLLGLACLSAKGLSTGSNSEHLAYIEGSYEAQRVREKNDEFKYNQENKKGYWYISRVVTKDRIADVHSLSDSEKETGIKSEPVWVPLQKAGGKETVYYYQTPVCIDWSKDSIQAIKDRSSGRLRRPQFYFKDSVFLSSEGNQSIRARFVSGEVLNHSGNIMIPLTERISPKYLVGFLNSDVVLNIVNRMINHTVNTEVRDIRRIPTIIPDPKTHDKIVEKVDAIIDIKKGDRTGDVEDIQSEIDSLIENLYGVSF